MKVDPKVFRAWCKAKGLPRPDAELTIIPGRRFRHDFGWPAYRVVIEVQGGVWSGGAHGRGVGITRDQEKLNLTTVAGWRTLQLQPKHLMTDTVAGWLRELLQ